MVDLRLRTPVRRAFSRKTSLVGYAVLCAGVAGSLIFTLTTRAKQDFCHTWWISPSNAADNLALFDNGACSSAVINSGACFQHKLNYITGSHVETTGQTFSNSKSAYVWTAATWANFTRPAALQGCKLLDGSGMLVDSTIRSVCQPALYLRKVFFSRRLFRFRLFAGT